MWLIVGLGNPGSQYARNRHNIGFLAVDDIVRRQGSALLNWRTKFNSQSVAFKIADQDVLVLKPETFMNNSGQAVQAAANFYKIQADNIIVLHDELDLEPGQVRVKRGGGNAGHNGLKSIDAVMGADYYRVRLGIGRPEQRDLVTPYVLGNFAAEDSNWIETLLNKIAENIPLLIKGDMTDFQTRIGGAPVANK